MKLRKTQKWALAPVAHVFERPAKSIAVAPGTRYRLRSMSGSFRRRRHLFEFGDQPWMTGRWRRAYLDCLNLGLRIGGQYRTMHRPFSAWATTAGEQKVLDLGSGGAAPLETLLREAAAEKAPMPCVVLSDLYPSPDHYRAIQERWGADRVQYIAAPVSATEAQRPDLPLRSICSTFHHFKPALAGRIVDDALRNGRGLFVMEPLQRDLGHFLLVLLSGPFVYMLAPFLQRRVTLFNILFCTLLPIIPLMVMFDGCVSVLRMHTPDEIEGMVPQDLRAKVNVTKGVLPYMGAFGATYVALTRKP